MSPEPLPIPYTPEYLEELKALVPDEATLALAGYVMEELSCEALELKKRCCGCGKPMSRFQARRKRFQKTDGAAERSDSCNNLSTELAQASNGTASIAESPNGTRPQMRCQFHSGILRAKVWSCCGAEPSGPPCESRESHRARTYREGEIEKLWQYYHTPGDTPGFSHRQAVAIDCEMGTAMSGDSELIRVTLLDFFSGQVLIDRLVFPDVPMLHLNTRYSGVRPKDMTLARRVNNCFFGRDHARLSIFEYVGPDTLVVGHSALHDLTSLRWIHPNIVDTFILESAIVAKEAKTIATEALTIPLQSLTLGDCSASGPAKEVKKKNKGSGRLSLKTLSKTILNRDIQVGNNGHDSVEDALAARDLAHAYLIARHQQCRISEPSDNTNFRE